MHPAVGTIAVTGMHSSGKSLLMSLLTGADYAQLARPQQNNKYSVKVPHSNLEILHKKEGEQKACVSPFIDFIETPGLSAENNEQNLHPLNILKSANAVIVVLDAFEAGATEELLLKQREFIIELFVEEDRRIAQGFLERYKKEQTKKPNDRQIPNAVENLNLIIDRLGRSDFDQKAILAVPEMKLISLMPVIFIANLSESNANENFKSADMGIPLKFEYDVLQLDSEDERKQFLKEFGIETLKSVNLVKFIYEKSGFITFLTSGDKDATGWGVRKGATAVEAAGAIHTDIAKGFVNGEIVGWEDYVKEAGLAKCKHKGLVRKVDKNYVMNDSDIVTFNFSPPKR
ncbi:MAG: DUF933 domain-containing protein [Planctomycetes bacterium]|nr:DUF933 domain-containing protein [Planctomycetota bacterium]